eukprot:323149-Rhodomonas_salina.1
MPVVRLKQLCLPCGGGSGGERSARAGRERGGRTRENGGGIALGVEWPDGREGWAVAGGAWVPVVHDRASPGGAPRQRRAAGKPPPRSPDAAPIARSRTQCAIGWSAWWLRH